MYSTVQKDPFNSSICISFSSPVLTRTVKVRPPTRSLASRTTVFSPLAFNSFAALKPANERRNRGSSKDTYNALSELQQDCTCILLVHDCHMLVLNENICVALGELILLTLVLICSVLTLKPHKLDYCTISRNVCCCFP